MTDDPVRGEDLESLASTSEDSVETCLDRDENETVLLGELVGARSLSLPEDFVGEMENDEMQPFCVVRYGGHVIHKSKQAEDVGCDPIWTVATKSLFLVKCCPDEMSRTVLNITVYTKRKKALPVRLLLAESLFIGQVNLDARTILSHCDEQRFEMTMEDEIGEPRSSLGVLSLRFRLATNSDQEFVRMTKMAVSRSKEPNKADIVNRMLERNRNEFPGTDLFHKGKRPLAAMVTEKSETEVAQTSFVNAVSNVFSYRVIRDRKTGQQKVRVKPSPDPTRPEQTKFMTPAEISMETRQPSHRWVEAGSGKLGKLYLEILSCHDLPNVDVGEAVGNVTDSFVCAVYEDSCAMTEVIDDELCPHWLPWTQRAFCFGMIHPASILYLGVFDYDLGIGNHEALGRVAVNVCNLQHNTVYTLKYNLYPSSNVTDRIANGSITIRLRVECFDEKAAILAAIKPRPKIHVNVCKEKSFKVVRYTCFGEYDNEEKFDLTVTRSYVNEIFAYKSAITYCVGDAVRSLIFWRGQVEVFSILLPIHSMAFFCATTTLVERPYLIVPFTLLGVAGIMLAALTLRQQHPSPWNRVPSFWHYLSLLRNGVSPVPLKNIAQNEGLEEAKAYEQAWTNRLEEDRIVAEKRAELQEEIDKIGDDMISTKVSNAVIPIDLLNRLGRYQGIVGRVCRFFRLCKIIVTWEESVVSFWITAGFLSAGILSLVLPWAFILTWTGRIITWGLFGPHMKLVDLYLGSQNKNDGTLQTLAESFNVQKMAARLRREEALKLKDMKSLAFGVYNIHVPCFNLARHYDRPLPASSARVCRRTPHLIQGMTRRTSVANLNSLSPWIPGQQLYGVMIPRPEHALVLYQREACFEQQRLKALETRVLEIMDADYGTNGRTKLSKLGYNNFPLSLGFEVVPQNVEPSSNGSNESKTLISVTLRENDLKLGRSSSGVILESDGCTTYDVSGKWMYDRTEEAGLEIIAMGRLSTFQQDFGDDGEEDYEQNEESEGLSLAYNSSTSVQVAFYRPPRKVKTS